MSETATLARPYAVAAYKRAKETYSVPAWSDALVFLAAVLKDPGIARAASNPKAGKDHFIRALLDLGQGQLAPEMENFIRLLVANRRLGLIHSIREQFESFRADDEGVIEVQVRSAFYLGEVEQNQISSALRQLLNKEPRLSIWEDPDLIGGVVMRAGDRVIDASVRGQIQRLAKTLFN